MATAGMDSRQRRRVVDHICARAKTLCTIEWNLDTQLVWRNFTGRRGGFDAQEVIDFITLGTLVPYELHPTGEYLRLREMLRDELGNGEPLWIPRRKRDRSQIVVPQAFDPRLLMTPPTVVDSDNDEDTDLALAIRLSLEDEHIRREIEAPVSPAQHIPEESDDEVLAFNYMAPVVIPDNTCLLCSETKPVFCVTQCCNHRYCRECIRSTFRHAEGLPRCPDCVAHGQPPVSASTGIRADAQMNMDPYCIKAADADLCHSRHLAPFLNTFDRDKLIAVCPLCETTAYGSAIPNDRNCCRCPNLKCSLLFCRACAQPYHGLMKCKVVVLPTDATYLKNQVRLCPVCSETIQHFRNHGCHHVTCPSCSTELCYACGKTKYDCDNKPFRRRCPIFCNSACGCPDCDDCRPGHKCTTCTGCKICGVSD